MRPPGTHPQRALLKGLRRSGDEAQLTRALQALFEAEPACAASFVELLLRNAPAARSCPAPPVLLSCYAEEVVETGRLDLRFSDDDAWDVIVELKLYASYGRDQLDRYLSALRQVDHGYLIAVTRDVPIYGETHLDEEPRWLGSVRWRSLLPALRALPFESKALGSQWRIFLDVLESEGSMGFTNPDPSLFDAWSTIRPAVHHTEDFLKALQQPLLEALQDALAKDGLTADFHRAQKGKGKPVISKQWSGIIDLPFVIPANGHASVRAGIYAQDPPTRFYVAPQWGRRLSARRHLLPESLQDAVSTLVEAEFRDYDLRAFYELTDKRLKSPTLEETIVVWAHEKFAALVASGLLDAQHHFRGATFAVPGEDEGSEA